MKFFEYVANVSISYNHHMQNHKRLNINSRRLLSSLLFLLALLLIGRGVCPGATVSGANLKGINQPKQRAARGLFNHAVSIGCTGADDTSALTAAIRKAQGKTIVIALGQVCSARDLTIPNLRIEKGGLLKPVTSHTIILSGSFEAGPYQCFTNALAGEGTISFSGNQSLEAVNVQWWGGLARSDVDQAGDDTKPIEAAFSSKSKKITIPDGHYMIDAVTVQPGQTKAGLNLVSNTEVIMGTNTFLHVKNNASVSYNVLVGWKVSNVRVRGGYLVGDNLTNSRNPDANPGGYGLALFGVSNVQVYGVTAQDMFADGFLICYDDEAGPHPESENVHLINCTAYRNYRQGASIVGAKNGSLEGGKYYGTRGSPPQDGIDIEPNADIHGPGNGSIVSDFHVSGVVAMANAGSGIEVVGQSGTIMRVDIIQNQAYSNSQQGIVYRGSSNGKINNNRAHGNARNGISVYHSSNIEVANNASYENKQNGIIIQNPSGVMTHHITLNNNSTERNDSAGIAIVGFLGKPVQDVILRGNTAAGNGGNGIALDFAENVQIDGNKVEANSQNTDNRDDNILLTNSVNCSISNNTVRRGNGIRQPRYGISLSSSVDTIVRHNDLVTAGKMNAISDTATRSDLSGNKLTDAPIRNHTIHSPNL
jgi:parallel beta-helix repeat protein